VGDPKLATQPVEEGLASGTPVIYIGTFTKTLFAGLRLAYLVLPPAVVEKLSALTKKALGWDYGPFEIPEAILSKPGPLDPDEWEFIKRHTLIGERIVAAAPALARIAPIVRSSHERADGSGYPDGLGAEAIPLGARIVAVVDAFDAMIAGRPYRPAVPVEEAIAELRRCTGSQFDAAVVQAFVDVIERAENRTRAA
jgi:HD-GYP domain-containing protein (c-di-GMP phosphodiesterase class II)